MGRRISSVGPSSVLGKVPGCSHPLSPGDRDRTESMAVPRTEGKPDNSHDLLRLFDGLGEATRTRLAAKLPELPNPLPGFPPIRPGMRETLRSHKEAFVHWRYLYENSTGMFQTAAIEEVLAATIDVYDKAVDESP